VTTIDSHVPGVAEKSLRGRDPSHPRRLRTPRRTATARPTRRARRRAQLQHRRVSRGRATHGNTERVDRRINPQTYAAATTPAAGTPACGPRIPGGVRRPVCLTLKGRTTSAACMPGSPQTEHTTAPPTRRSAARTSTTAGRAYGPITLKQAHRSSLHTVFYRVRLRQVGVRRRQSPGRAPPPPPTPPPPPPKPCRRRWQVDVAGLRGSARTTVARPPVDAPCLIQTRQEKLASWAGEQGRLVPCKDGYPDVAAPTRTRRVPQ